MHYRIKFADGTTHLVQITAALFKKWKVWKVEFADGKAAMLLKSGNEWLQRNEDILDAYLLNALGKLIDDAIISKKGLSF
ncbi:hypothetical protein FFF34_007840 [Inquilinus sp. KBS0705]|nr:hypothetical protein FFF34_007840 [Inquilinus sp. KBS0705]